MAQYGLKIVQYYLPYEMINIDYFFLWINVYESVYESVSL